MIFWPAPQGYRVLHRPWAFVQWLPYMARLPEDYVLMAEPDHIFVDLPPLWCASVSRALGGFMRLHWTPSF